MYQTGVVVVHPTLVMPYTLKYVITDFPFLVLGIEGLALLLTCWCQDK